jgi:hypothetical protein
MVPIKSALVNNKLILGCDVNLWQKFGNKSSFTSVESFESFGSMGVEEGILIMNPGEYTVQPEEVETPKIRKSKINKTDIEA